MVSLKVLTINIRLDKNGQLRQKINFEKMKVDRNIKLPDLILSSILLSKTNLGFKTFFRK